ncbi:MAG TPA: hypothetical protein PK867_18965, partial [Pirellulales bacterium]|nr:hypothetical protein [Pirellulales bacterium]
TIDAQVMAVHHGVLAGIRHEAELAVHAQFLEASEWCRGRLLSRAGMAAGIAEARRFRRPGWGRHGPECDQKNDRRHRHWPALHSRHSLATCHEKNFATQLYDHRYDDVSRFSHD